jgi:ketosteroid isomerase-like protein
MRKIVFITVLLLFAGFSFGQVSNTSPVAMEAEEAALNELMDKFDAAIEALDVSTLVSFFTEDALFCGTDPSEFWNKQQITDIWEQSFSNSVPEFRYINDRKVKVAPDGHSAIVVTQFIISWSPKIPWRQVFHCVKKNDNWMVHFMNTTFIPKNEDIQKINEAVE